MKGRWRPANSEHAETEQVVGRDGGRRKKSDERHWGASARGPAERARARPPAGSRADFFRSLAPPTGRRSRVCGAVSTSRTVAPIVSDLDGCSTLRLTCAINPQSVLVHYIIVNGLPGGDIDTEVKDNSFFLLKCANGLWTALTANAAGNIGRQVDRYACVNTVS
uniref:Calpain catalytic domain-containing protein n=1 Tax=Globodera pallida TaxID=36090 RepID=A0A183BRJ4_GLOPA